LAHHTKTEKKYQTAKNIPNSCKIHIPNGHKIYQHFAFRGPQKYTQIFCMKIVYHLATLLKRTLRTYFLQSGGHVHTLTSSLSPIVRHFWSRVTRWVWKNRSKFSPCHFLPIFICIKLICVKK
jgi:hypothetical protein